MSAIRLIEVDIIVHRPLDTKSENDLRVALRSFFCHQDDFVDHRCAVPWLVIQSVKADTSDIDGALGLSQRRHVECYFDASPSVGDAMLARMRVELPHALGTFGSVDSDLTLDSRRFRKPPLNYT